MKRFGTIDAVVAACVVVAGLLAFTVFDSDRVPVHELDRLAEGRADAGFGDGPPLSSAALGLTVAGIVGLLLVGRRLHLLGQRSQAQLAAAAALGGILTFLVVDAAAGPYLVHWLALLVVPAILTQLVVTGSGTVARDRLAEVAVLLARVAAAAGVVALGAATTAAIGHPSLPGTGGDLTLHRTLRLVTAAVAVAAAVVTVAALVRQLRRASDAMVAATSGFLGAALALLLASVAALLAIASGGSTLHEVAQALGAAVAPVCAVGLVQRWGISGPPPAVT